MLEQRRDRGSTIGAVAVLAATLALLLSAGPAHGAEQVLQPASYPGMATYACRTAAIDIHPGQNLNDFGSTSTCPNAQKLSGPGGTSQFAPGSKTEGYVTRFQPSMLEILPGGKLVTPAVWDLHLHHVVWIAPGGGPTFASGEEKTIPMLPQGYGFEVEGGANWVINQMIHNLNSSDDRRVYLTWEIDWVPETAPARTDIEDVKIAWMDVAGFPQIYPVFDAEKDFDSNGDGKYVFPDEVPTDPAAPGYEERQNISSERRWVVPAGGATLVFASGHLHPGGLSVGLNIARDGPDPGNVAGDLPSERKRLFQSKARYYDPKGAVSWDLAMKVTRPEWRIKLKKGDVATISVVYDVRRASWYESMGIMPLAWTKADDPLAKDPFDDAAAVEAMFDAGGVVSHGRLPENIDSRARKNLKLPDPRKLKPKRKWRPRASRSLGPISIDGFFYEAGGFNAVRRFPKKLMRPPVVKPGGRVTFRNLDAQPGEPQTEQVWHSITSCRAPCNKGSGIGYPLANGPVKFDSGQLGFGSDLGNREVTTGTDTFTTPPLKGRGKTYTYFCRIHPAMRGSVRVKGKRSKGKGKKSATVDFSGSLASG